MKDQKGNMEDFFKNGMDGFNESPTDMVWDGINTELDANVPFYKKLFKWNWKMFTLFCIIGGLLFSNLYFIQKNKLQNEEIVSIKNELKTQSKELKESLSNASPIIQEVSKNKDIPESKIENKTVQSNDSKIATNSKSLKSNSKTNKKHSYKGNATKKNKTLHSTKIPANEPLASKIVTDLLAEKAKTKVNLSNKMVQANSKNTQNSRSISEEADQIESNDKNQYAAKTTINEIQNSRPISDKANQMESSNNLNATEIATKETNNTMPASNEAEQIVSNENTQNKGEDITLKDEPIKDLGKKSFLSGLKLPKLDLINLPYKNGNGRFIFGTTQGLNFVNTDQKTRSHAGFVAGLNLEYQLNPRFSITSTLNYNFTEYIRSNLDLNSLSKFPDVPFDEEISELSVRNQYLDATLGVCLKVPLKHNLDIVINPGIGGQFHLPQEFDYTSFDGQSLEVKPIRFFGYLGALNLNVGFEKKIGRVTHWRITGFAEENLTPIGLEAANTFTFGVKNTFLFGYKLSKTASKFE